MALSAVMLIMYFAMEVSYDSNVEYIVNSQGLNRVKAYYAAKSGLQLSLLRIKIYQQVQSQFGKQLGSNSALLEQIWSFPFAWPLPIGDELNAVDKDAFKKIFKESTMDSSYMTTITDEGSKIDINDLASPSKTLQEATKQQLLNIFEQKQKDDDDFRDKYSGTRFDELVNTIGDWVSDKNTSLNGGDKRSRFSELNSEAESEYYPPNRAFRSVSELHLVPGMNDDFFDLLAPRITVYGMRGINPNLASKEVIKSLDPGITDEVVEEVLTRRNAEDKGGPFKCDKDGQSQDFWDFVQQRGARLQSEYTKIPMTCDTAINFRIISTGSFAGATREIEAVVMDLDKTAEKIKSFAAADKKAAGGEEATDPATGTPTNPTPGATANPAAAGNQKSNTQPSKGPPRIVYWNER